MVAWLSESVRIAIYLSRVSAYSAEHAYGYSYILSITYSYLGYLVDSPLNGLKFQEIYRYNGPALHAHLSLNVSFN